MVDYEMDEVCSACGAPAGEPCRPDCTGICCDTGETQEVKALRSEVARLRHALDESNAAMHEANERAAHRDFMRAGWRRLARRKAVDLEFLRVRANGWADEATRVGWELDDAERIASLAMSEGLRAVEQEAAEADALSDALAVARGKASRLVEAARGVVSSCGMSTSPHYVAVPVGRVDELSAALAAWEKG